MDSPKYIKEQQGSWRLLIRKEWQAIPFLRLLGEETGQEGSKVTPVRSSDYTNVYRFTAELNGRQIGFYCKEYLLRNWRDRIKSLLRPSRARRAFEAGLMLELDALDTPRVALLGQKKVGPFCLKDILVTEDIGHAQSLYPDLCAQWANPSAGSFRQRRQISRDLGRTVGRMHAAGICHGDLRAGNILAAQTTDGWQFYLIDNERTRRFTRLPFRHRRKNLVQLNMLPHRLSETDRMRFWKAYLDASDSEKKRLSERADEVLWMTRRRLFRRLHNHRQDFNMLQNGNRKGLFCTSFGSVNRPEELLGLLDQPPMDGDVLKDDRSTRVVRCRIGDHDVVIKRYNHQGLWHSFRHTLKGSRAAKCWRYGHLLAALQIPCARPLAYIEERRWGLLWSSCVVNEFVEGPLLHAVMTEPGYADAQRRDAMEQARRLLGKLGRYRLTHGDMKSSNMLICNGRPVLIDLDSMRQHRFTSGFKYRYQKMINYFYLRLYGKNPPAGRPVQAADHTAVCR